MEKKSRTTHVVVGGHEFDHEIPHREHRLAIYLSEKTETNAVYWVFPGNNKKIDVTKKAEKLYQISVPTDKLIEIPKSATDKVPFKYYYKHELEKVLKQKVSGKSTLWYYSPVLSFISNYNGVWNTIVYDCSDNHTTIGWIDEKNTKISEYYKRKIDSRFKYLSERKIVQASDIIFVSSDELYEKLYELSSSPIFLEETGVDVDSFNTNETKDEISQFKRPILGFVGKLKRKIDYNLLTDVAKQNPNWNIVLVGPNKNSDIDELVRQKNVNWIGAVPPEEVPKVMNTLDVGLMPYRDIEYNKSVFPLKFYEYLASGLPVVGCGLPSTEKYSQEGVYMHSKNDSKEFSKCCMDVISWKSNTEQRRELAAKSDWQQKLDRIYNQVMNKI